jgi:membrane protein YqaA with SNARE-associated domain
MREKVKLFYIKLISKCRESKNKIYLYIISFLESIIFPLPTDIFLIPFVLAEKKNYWHLALMTTIFSVLGGCFSYLIGSLLWEQANIFFLEYYPSVSSNLNSFILQFKEYGIALIVIGGFSPFPYKVTCIASGIMNLNFAVFIIFSFLSRGVRFLLVCYLLFKFQEKANELIPKYIGTLSLIFLFILFLYFFL